ncbi:thioredoxin fold domain-containing protein [Suicoccus acidiformans]|uniref:thioredoxin fold domain-containing protein n=1 Tax=Suicoccus acidiformans TaxID=2036206 RepID=UPI0013C3097F|nr:thioredoxin fold domain-containing protein [Suicoccus acidiformans]
MNSERFEQLIADHFEEVGPEAAQEAIESGEETILFVGRSTCPYCQKFLPKLSAVVKEANRPAYFLDSEKPEQLDEVNALRETYDMKTVPSLLYSQGDTISVRSDSSMSEDEIKDFIQSA